MKVKITIALLAAPIPPAMWWLGGYNFDERGVVAVALGVCTLLAIIAPLTYPT